MATIEIQPAMSLKEIAKLYSILDVFRRDDADVALKFPRSFVGGDFGVLFSFLQFFSTWVRYPKSTTLHLPVEQNELGKYLDEEFVYPCIALAWEKTILDVTGNSARQALKTLSQNYFQRMEFFDLPSKAAVPIYCFDHDKNKRGHSRVFYTTKQEFYSESAVAHNLTLAFKKIATLSLEVFRSSVAPVLDNLFAIIHELFGNTNDHARTSADGFNLYPNIRALYLKFHKRPIQKLVSEYAYHEGLTAYFTSGFSLNSINELYLIELSVLDSGPGLARRYSKTAELNVPIADEVTVVKECLQVHKTSETGERHEVKGLGLDRVLQTLDGKGFLRIKSGKAEVFRDLKNSRYIEGASSSEISLTDWETNSPTMFTSHPAVEGTLISIFYPLAFEK